MTDFQRAIAELIYEFRKEKNISQQGLADMIDATRTTISNIETGRQSVTLEMFISIARAFSKDPGVFLNTSIARSHHGSAILLEDEAPDLDMAKLRNVNKLLNRGGQR